ncbi:helix-turn-helix domain-containing protein [Sphingomonas jaspsi]|uniref:helix-turn-helix domain-containing protein n=1 Tax=Sphingomonas jaspsi TaxID=392409 RepID=UPI0005623F2F|nr:helix-turn-helix transcriptional regulator [Sphingomonas jaspsi]
MPKSIFTDANQVVVDALVSARKAAGLRQEDLASKLGKNQSLISRIESGQRRLDVVEFYAVATAIGADPVELYGSIVKCLPQKVEI